MKPIISIVTGTYNRLQSLQRMVASVRKSIGRGMAYQIIIVDGGSTDGTPEWCTLTYNSDIKFIQQGKLLGAVKAFNEGASKADGEYVILANDDIEFVDESIVCAIRFMEDNRDVGIGCFWQDRGGKAFHVEQMPAVLNGKQISYEYGQVCIVPRWLGNQVGWWGDYLHTYGGDNELSCNVLELGYDIKPIPCACIRDFVVEDKLREINKGTPVSGQHPDTAKWLAKWTKDGMVGARMGSKRDPSMNRWNVVQHMRILYAPIFEPEYDLQRKTKRGLRDALGEFGFLVYEYDYMKDGIDGLFDMADRFEPHILLTQIQSVKPFYTGHIKQFRKEFPNTVLINWNGDYNRDNLYDQGYIDMMALYDLCGFVTTSIDKIYNANKVNWFYWQIGYEEANNVPDARTAQHDVLFIGNAYSQARLALGRMLRSKAPNVGLYGYWPRGMANGYNLYDFDAAAKLYANAKISIGDSQWPHVTGFVSNRLFQAMSAGAFMLHQQFDGMDMLGLVDGVHLVVWNDLGDMVQKINQYIRNPGERQRIAQTGQKYVLEHHSFRARVAELWKELISRNLV